jgi:hypothetical protein
VEVDPPGPPSPQARALELALSVPTSSHYEAAAIYQAALFHEEIAPGTLTKLAGLPKVKASRITDARPLPLGWSVVFTDARSGKTFSTQCFFSLSSVIEFRAVVETGIQTARRSPSGRLIDPKQLTSTSATSRL